MCVILLYSVFLDVYDVLCPVYLNTCVRVCHSQKMMATGFALTPGGTLLPPPTCCLKSVYELPAVGYAQC